MATYSVKEWSYCLIASFNSDVVRGLQTADARERFGSQGIEVQVITPVKLGQRVVSEIERWRKVILAANVKAE